MVKKRPTVKKNSKAKVVKRSKAYLKAKSKSRRKTPKIKIRKIKKMQKKSKLKKRAATKKVVKLKKKIKSKKFKRSKKTTKIKKMVKPKKLQVKKSVKANKKVNQKKQEQKVKMQVTEKKLLSFEMPKKPVMAKSQPKINYMVPKNLLRFRALLLKRKEDLMAGVDKTIHHMQDEAANFADPNDRATQEEEFSLELRTRDRERKLMTKIDEALERIDNGDYGFCEECGIEIGIERLEARPTATLCIDCKALDEIREKQLANSN